MAQAHQLKVGEEVLAYQVAVMFVDVGAERFCDDRGPLLAF